MAGNACATWGVLLSWPAHWVPLLGSMAWDRPLASLVCVCLPGPPCRPWHVQLPSWQMRAQGPGWWTLCSRTPVSPSCTTLLPRKSFWITNTGAKPPPTHSRQAAWLLLLAQQCHLVAQVPAAAGDRAKSEPGRIGLLLHLVPERAPSAPPPCVRRSQGRPQDSARAGSSPCDARAALFWDLAQSRRRE